MNLYSKTISKSLILNDDTYEKQIKQTIDIYDNIFYNNDIIPKNRELIHSLAPEQDTAIFPHIADGESNNFKYDNINVNTIHVNKIKNKDDILIKAKKNHVVKIPNIKNRTIKFYKCEKNDIKLDPIDIKSYKIFIVETNVLLCNDKSIDGIEIFIYNDSSSEIMISFIKDCKKELEDKIFINNIPPNEGNSYMYLHYLKKWIKY